MASPLQLEATQGATRDFLLQVTNPDGSIPNQFLSTDALTATVWEGQNQATIFSPTVSWFTGLSSLVLVTGGTLYTAPSVSLVGGGGTGATATAVVVGGTITNLLMTNAGSGYTSNPTVVITDSTGSGAAGTATAAIGWLYGQVAIEITGANSSGLDPAGVYHLQVNATRSGVTANIIDCLLKIIASPGAVTPAPPDLITYDYAEALLSELTLSNGQVDFLPYLVSAASALVRKFCFDRYFDLRTIVEKYDIALDGTVRLRQVPITIILRVQAQPSLALTVYNNSTSVQYAQAYFAFTGVPLGYGSNAQTATGITLNWVSNGVLSSQIVNFTANETISTLSTAINAVGSGWVATASSVYGAWPVTELDGGYVAQGCALTAVPTSGAQFNVLLDLTNTSLNSPQQGILWVGRQYQNSDALRWGPGGFQVFSSQYGQQLSQAKVTYMAGFSTIPAEVQYWTGQTVKWLTELDKQEVLLISERAADYQYQLNTEMVRRIPRSIQEGLSQWRLHYA